MADPLPDKQPFHEIRSDDLDSRLRHADPTPKRSLQRWQPPTAKELQAMVSRYEIIELVGVGGMGAVYKARQPDLDRIVAIKILPIGIEENDKTFVQRFKKEAQALAKLSHPGIVMVHDFYYNDLGLFYFVMEFVEGMTVEKMVRSNGKLDPSQALAITAHVCDALQYAHSRSIIHRDITPANIMVNYDGQVKIADFGLAKVLNATVESTLTGKGERLGTLFYMAPESLENVSAADQRADIYSVGAMLYHMLTSKMPQGVLTMPSGQTLGLDKRYDDIITRAMQKDLGKRYQRADEMRRDLDDILSHPVAYVDAPAREAPAAMPEQLRPENPNAPERTRRVITDSGSPAAPARTGTTTSRTLALRRTVRKSMTSTRNSPMLRTLGLLMLGSVLVLGIIYFVIRMGS